MSRLADFDEARRREGALNRLPPRLLPIEVKGVVGSVTAAKVQTLTGDFLLREGGTSAPRYRSVHRAMRTDVPLPPIEVYALRGAYYVVDGHHRVAAARALGYLYIDALVHEFLLPATTAGNQLHNERLHFARVSGLDDVVVTETGQYRKLFSQIREHQFFMGEAGRPATLKAAAADWRDDIYTPTCARLATGGVPYHFPGRTLADLYVYLCDYKWVKSQNKGMDIGFSKALADFERLYPAPRGVAALLTVGRRRLGALTRRTAKGRRARASGAPPEDLAAITMGPCPMCGQPMDADTDTTTSPSAGHEARVCAGCRHDIEVGA